MQMVLGGPQPSSLSLLQANTARALAVQEVQRLLDSADSLKRLPQLRENVLAKQLVSAC